MIHADGALSRSDSPELPSVLPFSFVPFQKAIMDLFELTRALVDIESVTNNEAIAGEFLFRHLAPLAAKYGGHIERIPVEAQRLHLFSHWGQPGAPLPPPTPPSPPLFPF